LRHSVVGSLRQSGKLFQMVGPDIVKRHPRYVESLTGGTRSWFLLTDLRQSQDDELCDAGWEHTQVVWNHARRQRYMATAIPNVLID